MKSSLRNMVLSLTGLTLVVGGALAGVNLLTAEPIREASRKARVDAMAAILPSFDNDISAAATDAGNGLVIYPALLGDQPVGAAVETFSDNGFSGRFTVLVGFDSQGAVSGYRVLEHSETPGLGAKMGEWFMAEGTGHDVVGSAGPLSVKADGGEIDAITGATITSRAFLEALNKARDAYNEYKTKAL